MKDGKCCVICKLVALLAALGAINWGLVAFFHLDLVAKVLGPETTGAKVVYGLIGVAGLIVLAKAFGFCCPCSKGGSCAK